MCVCSGGNLLAKACLGAKLLSSQLLEISVVFQLLKSWHNQALAGQGEGTGLWLLGCVVNPSAVVA